MNPADYKYVRKETTRHGKTVFYFKRPSAQSRIRLPDDPLSKDFAAAYRAAFNMGIRFPRPKRVNAEAKLRQHIERCLRRGLEGARARARAKGLEFDLSLDWALAKVDSQNARCAITAIPFLFAPKGASFNDPYRPSIDRIDARGGYSEANCRIVIYAVNVMFFDWGEDIFRHVVNCYRLNRKRTLYARTLNPECRTAENIPQ